MNHITDKIRNTMRTFMLPAGRLTYPTLLVIVVFCLYGLTLSHGFVWDDLIYTVNNRSYEQLSFSTLFLTLANRVEYLPIRDLSYALDYQLWGWNPLGFHATNVLLFTFTCITIYFFTASLPFIAEDPADRRIIAFLTSLIIAVHPLLSESVNFITCRNVLLSGSFFFLTACLFIRYQEDASDNVSFLQLAGLILCAVAAVLSKATAIVMPLVLLMLLWYLPFTKVLRRQLSLFTPLFVLFGLVYVAYKQIALNSNIINQLPSGDFLEKLAIAVQIPFFYLQKFFIPFGYSAEYAPKFTDVIVSSPVLISLACILLLSSAAIVLRKHDPLIGFAVLWTLITMLPILNFFATNPMVADRYAFLPAYGFALLSAGMLSRLRKKFPKSAGLFILCLLLGLSAITVQRSLDWRSDLTLWQANIKTSPTNAKGYMNLVAEAAMAGNYALARDTLEKGRSAAPSPTYDYLEGILYLQQNQLDNAVRAFQEAIRKDPGHIRSLLELGRIYEEKGLRQEAIRYYQLTLSAEVPDGWGCRDQARQGLQRLGQAPLEMSH